MANSFGWGLGLFSWYVGTFHVYKRHYETADSLLKLSEPKSIYDYGIKPTRISSAGSDVDSVLNLFFKAENFSRTGSFQNAAAAEKEIGDPFFRQAAVMMRIYSLLLRARERSAVMACLEELEEDFMLAAAEYIFRKWRRHGAFTGLLSEKGKAFWESYLSSLEQMRCAGAR